MLRRTVLAGSLIIVIPAVLCTSRADARNLSFTGPRGGTWNRSVTHYNNGGGNLGRTATTTRPDGQTATNTFSRSVNNGTITDSHSSTGFNGRSSSGTLTRTPGQGGTGTFTSPAGETHSYSYAP